MRIFIGALLAIAAAVLLGAGFLAPVAAQQASRVNLPSTHFGSEQPVSPHGVAGAPGFAHARAAHNPDSPDAVRSENRCARPATAWKPRTSPTASMPWA
jgi:hypothetical protein